MPLSTPLRSSCILETPSETLNRAFVFAKDNITRCMRFYTLGWGMSNAPHIYTIVVGHDAGWMGVGADYVAPWFAPTFIWAVLEGLLGLTWQAGQPVFAPHWPERWEKVTIRHLPGGGS